MRKLLLVTLAGMFAASMLLTACEKKKEVPKPAAPVVQPAPAPAPAPPPPPPPAPSKPAKK